MAGRSAENVYGSQGAVPTVEPTGLNAPEMNIRSSPDAFGAQIGKGVQDVGEQANQLATHFAQIYSDAAARDGIVKASTQLGDLENEYRKNKGLNAADALPIFQQKTQELYENSVKSMPSLAAQKSFQDNFSREIAYSLKGAGAHAADQVEDANIKSIQASIANDQNQLALAANDPDRRSQVMQKLQADSLTLSHHMGATPEVADMTLSTHTGDGIISMIQGNYRTNPALAKQLTDEYLNGGFTVNRDGKQITIPYLNAEQRSRVERESFYFQSQNQKDSDTNIAANGGQIINNKEVSGNNQNFIPSDVMKLVDDKAKEIGVPADVARAVGIQESGMRQSQVGDSGKAVGVFQLHEGAAKDTGVDRTTLEGNVEGGLKYLKQMYDKYGDWDKAIAAFNAGPGAMDKAGGDITKLPPERQQYLTSVNALRRLDPQTLIDRVEGHPMMQNQIAQNLTSFTPLTDDAVTIDKTSGAAHDILQSAVDIKASMLKTDPAGYVMTHNQALAGMQTDILKNPQMLPYYIKTADNIYDSLQQPENNRPIFSQDYGRSLVNGIVTGGGLRSLESMQAKTGDNFPRVYNDLVRNGLPPQYQVMMNIDDVTMRQRLSRAYSAPEENKKEQAAVEKSFDIAMGGKGKDAAKTTVDAAIDSTASPLMPYFKTLSASGATASDLGAYRNVVKRLAYQSVLEGDSPQDAAKNAMSAITGKYDFFESARIPKSISPVIERNAQAFRNNLTADKIAIPSYAESPENYIYSLQHTGTFVTNNNESGLWLRDQAGSFVRDKTGNPVTIPFTMAQHIAQQNKIAQAQEQQPAFVSVAGM